jgi:hypothetical protein
MLIRIVIIIINVANGRSFYKNYIKKFMMLINIDYNYTKLGSIFHNTYIGLSKI